MIRKQIAVILLTCALAIPVLAQTQQKQEIGNVVIEGWQTVDMTREVWTFSGPNLRIAAKDGQFEAAAQKMIVNFSRGKSQNAVGSMENIKLTGGVSLNAHEETRSIAATADNASVDYTGLQKIILSGKVIIKTEDPALFVGPAIATGDKVTIDFKTGEERVLIESYEGTGKLEFTPKQTEKNSE